MFFLHRENGDFSILIKDILLRFRIIPSFFRDQIRWWIEQMVCGEPIILGQQIDFALDPSGKLLLDPHLLHDTD
jgi:hypothetical protein